jgi:hypothetical protein
MVRLRQSAKALDTNDFTLAALMLWLADLVPQVDEVTADSGVAPTPILFFEADHQIDDLLRDPRTPRSLTVLAAVILLGNEFAIPGQNGLWREEDRTLLQELSGQWLTNWRAVDKGLRQVIA